jgi:hypothetical protein
VFAAPSSPAVAGVQSTVVAMLFLGFGYLLADAALGRSDVSPLTRIGLAFPALAAYAAALTIIHILTGGEVFSHPLVLRMLTAATAAGLLGWKLWRVLRRKERGTRSWPGVLVLLAVMLAGAALWGVRSFQLLPLSQAGDTPWYMGLAGQLMNGERTPVAPITGHIPNFYPWLFHSVIALVARFTPGGRAYHALNVMQLLQPAGLVLALFATGWELVRRWEGAIAAAVFGGIAGGFTTHVGPLLARRPYNVALASLSPPYPGDMAIVLLVGFLALLVAGLRREDVRTLALAGVVLGLAGLTGAEAFFVGLFVAVLVAVVPGPIGWRRAAVSLLGPAVAIYAIWMVPLLINYVKLGGFVNITRVGPVNLKAAGILAAWGIATPFGAFGFARFAPRVRTDLGARVVVILFGAAAAILLLSGVIPGALGQAFIALGRRHRYWPLLHLGVALLAALGVTDLVGLASRARRWPVTAAVAVSIAVVVLFFGLRFPLSSAFARPHQTGPVLTAALEGQPEAVLNVLSRSPGECVAAVPSDLQIPAFGFTGYRLVLYRWPGYTVNLARIRWRDIYQFIPTDAERIRASGILTLGHTDPGTWAAEARTFGVDVIVVPAVAAISPVYDPYPRTLASGPKRDYVVIRLRSCR